MNSVIFSILGTIGGVGVVILGLSAWLGQVWAKRIVLNENAKHAQDLSRLNSELELERKRTTDSYIKIIELTNEIDIDLRNRRIEVYKELWKSTGLFPKWPKANNITYEDIIRFSESLKDWYFHKGGMFLSRSAHKEGYMPLQESIREILDSEPNGIISENHYETIRSSCTMLRTLLTDDVLSRKSAPNDSGLS